MKSFLSLLVNGRHTPTQLCIMFSFSDATQRHLICSRDPKIGLGLSPLHRRLPRSMSNTAALLHERSQQCPLARLVNLCRVPLVFLVHLKLGLQRTADFESLLELAGCVSTTVHCGLVPVFFIAVP
eukprot:6298317-Amphidinium_carterae.2